MFRMGTLLASACAIAAAIAIGGTALSQESPKKEEVFSVTTRIFLQNQHLVLFDISFDSAAKHTYVLGDRTNQQIDVVDTTTNKPPPTFSAIKGGFAGATGSNDTSGPDGVLIIDGDNEVWAGDGVCHQGEAHPVACEPVGPSSVKVFNLSTGTRTHVIPTGSASTPKFPGLFRADEMCLDPRDHLVMVANNADTPPYVSIIATAENTAHTPYTVVKQIAFDGNGAPNSNNGAEQCQWSPKTGKFYISIPGIVGGINGGGAVAVIDPKTLNVVNNFKIDGNDCIAPQGMAVGPNNQILLGCNGASGDGLGSTVIINANSGAIIAVLHHESGADEVWFNEGDGQYFLARSSAIDAPPQLLGVVDSVGHREDESHPTTTIANDGRNAHSVAADSIKNQVYVPIPAGVSTVCDPSNTDPTTGGNAKGCIAVYTVTKGIDDRPRTVLERPQDDHQE